MKSSKFKRFFVYFFVALLSSCGGQNPQDSNTNVPVAKTEASVNNGLLNNLAVLYPNGQLTENQKTQAAKELAQNPAALRMTVSDNDAAAAAGAVQSQSTGATVNSLAGVTVGPVYRIQNTTLAGSYFFTIYPSERDSALALHPDWTLEGPAFYAATSFESTTGSRPVYRFQNKINGSYLFTIYETERASIVANYGAYFAFEGVAWYANIVPDTAFTPLYRFRNVSNGTYLFTSYESEKNAILANYSAIFQLEGIAYYVRQTQPLSINLIAGNWANGLSGIADGLGSLARFNNPLAMASDTAGNLYVADTSNSTIRKITPTGLVSTFAGMAGINNSGNGTGLAAQFNAPSGIALDTADNVYVADTNNHTIRKITPAGVVTTFAGTAGVVGSSDGTGSAARFSSPQGLSVDTAGNVYVADSGNHTIRRINSAGDVTTIAGVAGSAGNLDDAGIAGSARFNNPTGIVNAGVGTLFVTDTGNHTVRRINPISNIVSTIAGTAGVIGYADGTGTATKFATPKGITRDAANNLYVADFINNSVRKITPTGVVSTVVGLGPNSGCRCEGPLPVPSSQPVSVHIAAGNLFFISDDAVLKINGLP
jgi:NHL repeat/Repeat of unknown function (DUF5648)